LGPWERLVLVVRALGHRARCDPSAPE
jgi:hypothetical protein